jgi:hypothetical protein
VLTVLVGLLVGLFLFYLSNDLDFFILVAYCRECGAFDYGLFDAFVNARDWVSLNDYLIQLLYGLGSPTAQFVDGRGSTSEVPALLITVEHPVLFLVLFRQYIIDLVRCSSIEEACDIHQKRRRSM